VKKIGLYHNNILVSIMTFDKSNFKKSKLKTELNENILRVYDCGKIKFEYTNI